MENSKFTDEEIKEIKMLQANLEMLSNTQEEAKARGREESASFLVNEVQDIKNRLNQYGPSLVEEITKKKEQENDFVISKPKPKRKRNIITDLQNQEEKKIPTYSPLPTKNIEKQQYDIIPLPSNGECYANKMSTIPVGFLTAYDENLITSPNLYRDGLVIDLLLKNKIMVEDFNPDDLCSGDADAVTLFLRESSYGPDFPVTVHDPKTDETFDTVIDLRKIKAKDFKLKSDGEGNFDFILPFSKNVIKFKFLTRKQLRQLDLINKVYENSNLVTMLKRATNEMKEGLKVDNVLTGEEKIAMRDSIRKIENWGKKLAEVTDEPFNCSITNKIEMHIVSIDGNTNRDYIHDFVENMHARDAIEFRKYISENEPGLNFNVEVERPEEFGGGSFTTFLEWDDTVFLNLA